MKRFIKWFALALGTVVLLVLISFILFAYKAKNGFPIYESQPPDVPEFISEQSILLFQKTNGFRHGKAIKRSREIFEGIAEQKGWGIYVTSNGAVFQPDMLSKFELIIMDNSTGPNLNDEQRDNFKNYVESGGSHMAIHGAGDGSSRWSWYIDNLIGAEFSHHSMNPHLQTTAVTSQCASSGFPNCQEFPLKWDQTDEWYVFFESPTANGFTVLYTIDENDIVVNGNIPFLVKNKDFGMGDDHPVLWYKCLKNGGKTLYSALGHNGYAYSSDDYRTVLVNSMTWLLDSVSCDQSSTNTPI